MAQEGKIDSVIGKSTIISGDIKVTGSTKVDGTVKGSITAKDSVIVGQDANIKGNVSCRNAIVGGKVEGNITVQEIVEFQSGAKMLGDIVCKGIIIQQGVFFDGNCSMSQREKDHRLVKESKDIKEPPK